jgi:hypothetical protein
VVASQLVVGKGQELREFALQWREGNEQQKTASTAAFAISGGSGVSSSLSMKGDIFLRLPTGGHSAISLARENQLLVRMR